MTALGLAPAPGAAPAARSLLAQSRLELTLTLRRGESVLLTILIPMGLLLFFSKVNVLPADVGRPVDFLVPGILALAVLSTCFTGQAIATAYERQYGVLQLLGATPLPRWVLLTGKTAAVLAVEVLQAGLLVGVGYALGWHPHGSPGAVLLLLGVGTVAFSGLGLLLAGRLRAEAVLAGANGLYLILLLLGGIIFPLSKLPAWLRHVADALPAAPLAHGLRAVLRDGAGLPGHDLLVLAAWAVGALLLASLTFRWAGQ